MPAYTTAFEVGASQFARGRRRTRAVARRGDAGSSGSRAGVVVTAWTVDKDPAGGNLSRARSEGRTSPTGSFPARRNRLQARDQERRGAPVASAAPSPGRVRGERR